MLIKNIISLANRLDEVGMTKEAEFLDRLVIKIANDEKWIQEAVTEEEEGKFEAWCKRHGYDEGVGQTCINEAARQGGEAAQMANFAVNVSDGKYTYPDTDNDE